MSPTPVFRQAEPTRAGPLAALDTLLFFGLPRTSNPQKWDEASQLRARDSGDWAAASCAITAQRPCHAAARLGDQQRHGRLSLAGCHGGGARRLAASQPLSLLMLPIAMGLGALGPAELCRYVNESLAPDPYRTQARRMALWELAAGPFNPVALICGLVLLPGSRRP